MNIQEARTILLLYRPGKTDTDDPQMAEALTLAKSEPELAAWLESHCATQEALRVKFAHITPPAGLKEQIISEHAAARRRVPSRSQIRLALAGVAAVLVAAAGIFWYLGQQPRPENTLASFKRDMVEDALRGYAMDDYTNNISAIRAFLATKHSPADVKLPAGLQKAEMVGCAIEPWQASKVSMVCFRTGKALPPGDQADLWLFVTDQASLQDPPKNSGPEFSQVNMLITATWTEGGKLYMLGVRGNEADIKPYLGKS